MDMVETHRVGIPKGGSAVIIDTDEIQYATMTEVLAFGKALVPKSLLDRMEAKDGDKLQWLVLGDGTVIVRKVDRELIVKKDV